MIVLGVDPGTAALGYGLVERVPGGVRDAGHGLVTTSADDPLAIRLLHLHDALAELVERHRPDLVAVERLFFSRNVQSAFAVGQARGVVLLVAARAGVPVREATPSAVKSAVTGHGAADKEQVGRMVAVLLGLAAVPSPDDVADALAVAICAAHLEPAAEARRAGGAGEPGAPVLDRAALGPIRRGETPYERAVREALGRERPPAARAGRRAAVPGGGEPR